mmetsp:Transcript_40757/g.107961  ORF Transcript_40757/g.107961 Transcript_40757/m.107961 type:complete len:771 (-) Transcript_40757:154-2466(-)
MAGQPTMRRIVMTIFALSLLAIWCFWLGAPFEIMVFTLLVAGYEGMHLEQRWRGDTGKKDEAKQDAVHIEAEVKPAVWRPDVGWRSKTDDGRKVRHCAEEHPAWRSKASDARSDGKSEAKSRKSRPDEVRKAESSRSLTGMKKTPQLQWRALINKFTPEKFDKLCGQLLLTLPGCAEQDSSDVSTDEYRQTLTDLLALIFEASSRQPMYTGMYTSLSAKILGFVAEQRPELDGRSVIWEKCQSIFLTTVLQPPAIPQDLPQDEYLDRKSKHKFQMVGMVKFGGDLVSHGLVPVDGVMQWIHALLSEKAQEINSSVAGELGTQEEKDHELREVQLEVLCAILASTGSSLSDSNTWSEDNRDLIEKVFQQLEELAKDQALSLRIRCLIRDILDLRRVQWKEKEGRLKPTVLEKRKKEDESEDEKEDSPEGKAWLDPQLLSSLQAVEHHLEVIEDRDAKLQRLKAVIQLYHFIRGKQIVIVAKSGNVWRVLDLIGEAFDSLDVRSLDFNTQEKTRKDTIAGFESGEVPILVMASEVSTRRDYDLEKPSQVLVNFDFPMTLQLYLFRIFKRADSNTHVYTFFMPSIDIRHTVPLIIAMEGAQHKIPPSVQAIKDQMKLEARVSKRGAFPVQDSDASGGRGEWDDSQRSEQWKHRRGTVQGDGHEHRDAQRDAHRDTHRDAHRDNHRDNHRDGHRETHRDTHRDAHGDRRWDDRAVHDENRYSSKGGKQRQFVPAKGWRDDNSEGTRDGRREDARDLQHPSRNTAEKRRAVLSST